MKKISVLFLFSALAVLLVQPAGAQTVHFGLKGGLNFATISYSTTSPETPPDLNTLSGQAAGFYANFKLGPVAVQPELLFSRRGTSFVEYDGEDAHVEGRYKFDYIELPILVKYSFLTGPAKPFLFAGPSFSFLYKARFGYNVDYPDTSESPDYEYYYEMDDYAKKFEFAAVFGAGVDFKLPKFMVSLDARYHLGFSNVVNNLDSEYEISMKHKGISVMVGIGF